MSLFSPSKATIQRQALKSTLRLLVMLREMLRAEGATDTDLFKSVVNHANMIGMVLPNKDRVGKDEIEKILAGIKSVNEGTSDKNSGEFRPPKPGEMVVLKPEQLRVRDTGKGGFGV